MFYNRYELKAKKKTHYRASSSERQTTLGSDYGLSAGDLVYARQNGYVRGFIVNDDALWRLDDDGNWPEAS